MARVRFCTVLFQLLVLTDFAGGSGNNPLPQNQTVTFANPGPQTVGPPLTLSASATSGLLVSFTSKTANVCSVSSAVAKFIEAGVCTIQATQAGNNTYAAAAPVSQSFKISRETQTIVLGPIAAQTVRTPLTLSASATSGLLVSFASKTANICSVSSTAAKLIEAGACTIQATQAGNDNYAAAAPVMQTLVVLPNPAPIVSSISPNFVVVGSGAQNLVLSGTGFLPTTTVLFAGIAHTSTHVSSTMITLPLTQSDEAKVGMVLITLINSAPGGGSAHVDLPVLFETDTMLAASQVAAGNQARLQRLIEKGRNGTPVTIAAIGGSITYGVGASNAAHNYIGVLQSWWNDTFPSSASTLVNAGIGSTASDYGALRVQRDVLSQNPDLVIVEFAVNDGADAQYGETYEGLVRQLLDSPSHPAVILLFMMKYDPPDSESVLTNQARQSQIGANYNLPMVSYLDAISPELQSGNIPLSQITADGTHPTDLGHAYAAQFLEQNLKLAMDNFPPGTALDSMPATQASLYSSDFEFTSLEDGIGGDGPALNPASNQGWIAEPSDPITRLGLDGGLQSSTPGSTLDFTVTGKDILIGYWVEQGPMGQASVTIDGAGSPFVLDGWVVLTSTSRRLTQVASGLKSGTHQIHVNLLSTMDSESTGTTFRLLCVGTGGAIESAIHAPGQCGIFA